MNPFGQTDASPMNTTDESDSQHVLPPCKDSINCLDQYSDQKSITHNEKYSHPCRFSELCTNIHDMSHCMQFTHIKTGASKCKDDGNCRKVTDPVHRYTYRHTDLPDLLYPCREGKACSNQSFQHKSRYSHCEKINILAASESSSGK